MKTCKGCGESLPLAHFSKVGGGRPGHRARCKACSKTQYAAWRESDPDRYREMRRAGKYRQRFSLSVDEVEALFAAANYRCEACDTHRDDTYNGCLVLDHDHSCCPGEKTCGKCVRGVMCTKCNLALGALDDSADRVAALLAYMEDKTNGATRRLQAS